MKKKGLHLLFALIVNYFIKNLKTHLNTKQWISLLWHDGGSIGPQLIWICVSVSKRQETQDICVTRPCNRAEWKLSNIRMILF